MYVMREKINWIQFYLSRTIIIAGFHCHAIKNINHNHSINKVKNLGYDGWLIYKPHKDLGLGVFIHKLFGEAFHPDLLSFVWRRHVGVHLDEHQRGWKVQKTLVFSY